MDEGTRLHRIHAITADVIEEFTHVEGHDIATAIVDELTSRGLLAADGLLASSPAPAPSGDENVRVARALRAFTNRVRSELDATRMGGINLGEDYLQGVYSALRQADDHAARIENDAYGEAPAPSEPYNWKADAAQFSLSPTTPEDEDVAALIAEAGRFDTEPAEYAARLLGAHELIDRLVAALAARSLPGVDEVVRVLQRDAIAARALGHLDYERKFLDVLALLERIPETEEWEYGVAEADGRVRGQFDGPRDRASVEAWWATQLGLRGRGCHLVRRRPAGPWEPIPESKEAP